MPKVHSTGGHWLITTPLGKIDIGPVEDEFKQRSVAVFINGTKDKWETKFLLSPDAAELMRQVLDKIKFEWNINDSNARLKALANGSDVRVAIKKLLQICKK